MISECGYEVDKLDPDALDRMDEEESQDDGEELEGTEATAYRALVARLNFLAQDRPDVRYATKEASKWMARPRQGHWGLLKRIGRYLKACPRLVQLFCWQNQPGQIDTYVDSDWAGCKVSCKSTSGGSSMIGKHTIMTWSTTQGVTALSSGEAELYAMVKGSAITLGLISLAHDFGLVLHGKCTATPRQPSVWSIVPVWADCGMSACSSCGSRTP